MKTIQAIRGMNDILPDAIPYWHHIEATFRRIMAAYGYQEIRFPIVENTDLFKRSIGEVTDIVEKEMYTFDDRNGDSLTLRPEGTAVCVRAATEHGLLYNQTQRLWYMGPMFRHERPQRGRYRQFHQIGVEAFGMDGPDIDVELILLSARLLRELGLLEHVILQLNSLGTSESRQIYRDALKDYLQLHHEALDEDSQRRLLTNPLRVLDSKNPALAQIIADAPKLSDYLDNDSRHHFDQLCGSLNHAGVRYEVNPCLVRGLDYYGKTVFEWVTDRLGAQGTVCAGGRYDGLVAHLGGRATPAVGFAAGIERLVELVRDVAGERLPEVPHVYLALMGEEASREGLRIAEQLRDHVSGLRVLTHCGGGGLKAQMKRADKSGAHYALLVGDDEIQSGLLTLKSLREASDQQQLTLDACITRLSQQSFN